MYRKSESGQVGLVILLTMVVLMTIGISVAARSVSELKLSRQEEETSRAFDVAETGIEEALGDLDSIAAGLEIGQTHTDTSEIGSTSLSYSVTKLNSLEARVEAGQTIDINVAGADATNTLQIEWALDQACPNAPAIEVTIFNDSGGTIGVRRQGYTKCGRGDNFTLVGSGSQLVNMQAGDRLVRIKPLYVYSMMRVTGVGNWLPEQSYLVSSLGQNTIGRETRVVEVNRSLPAAPSVFDYALFSGSSITK